MDPYQFNTCVLVPALNVIGLYSLSANSLMLGTALYESNLEYLEQNGGGTAKGVYQVEEKTYVDINRYLSRYDNTKLKERCLSACFYSAWPPSETLMYNLRWATVVTRIKYAMLITPLPEYDDVRALASYYKRFYNTFKGKADIDKVMPAFEHAIRIIKN